MANTFTPVVDPSTVFGNLRVMIGTIVATTGSGSAVTTGLEKVLGFSIQPKSAASAAYCSNWTISGGTITPGTCTAGDEFHAVIYGV